MPKAIEEHTPHRRSLLGGAAALLAGGTVLPAAAMAATMAISPDTGPAATASPEDADAGLLALIAAFQTLDRESGVLIDSVDHLPESDPASRAVWRRQQEQLSPRLLQMERRIAATAARTPDGLAAKAALARTMTVSRDDGTACSGDELVVSVLDDLRGLPGILRPASG